MRIGRIARPCNARSVLENGFGAGLAFARDPRCVPICETDVAVLRFSDGHSGRMWQVGQIQMTLRHISRDIAFYFPKQNQYFGNMFRLKVIFLLPIVSGICHDHR
jgi:hypothetical protein